MSLQQAAEFWYNARSSSSIYCSPVLLNPSNLLSGFYLLLPHTHNTTPTHTLFDCITLWSLSPLLTIHTHEHGPHLPRVPKVVLRGGDIVSTSPWLTGSMIILCVMNRRCGRVLDHMQGYDMSHVWQIDLDCWDCIWFLLITGVGRYTHTVHTFICSTHNKGYIIDLLVQRLKDVQKKPHSPRKQLDDRSVSP